MTRNILKLYFSFAFVEVDNNGSKVRHFPYRNTNGHIDIDQFKEERRESVNINEARALKNWYACPILVGYGSQDI
ncbi:MAG: hypothetical protein JRJ42_04140 [Deltaproteobacteria bacterium]|nr:hypothetical protein [Deltaproteobacteria bacterium]MBW2018620.1 hypothetical protein [Deltaproteobacteria bacterium]MBW2073886.1 hypothetical protein [Deltaproteobacteria bacterium]